MGRPLRKTLNSKSLSLIGIPKKFHNITIEDFEAFDEELLDVKTYVEEYISDIPARFNQNSGLLFFGSNGVGKTMLASIIAKECYRNRYSVRRVTFMEYISQYTRAWGAKTPEEKETQESLFYDNFKGVEFLVLEEVGKEIESNINVSILEDCLRYREDKGLVTIICTNLSGKNLFERYGASIESLIKGNFTPIKVVGKDRR